MSDTDEMGARLDVEQVRAQLHNIYDLATKQWDQVEQWPDAGFWTGVAVQVGGSKVPKTYLASLATALVARSTSSKIDATALMRDAGPGGYSAATVAKELYQFCSERSIPMKNIGPVPLNNSPFTGKRTVDPAWPNVAAWARPHLVFLRSALDKANELSRGEAELAAAVLFRQRLEIAKPAEQLPLTSPVDAADAFRRIAAAAAAFITEDTESGRRGQAFVAACLSLIYPVVESARINDPSRKHPGDVRGLRDGKTVVYAEVKQKTVPGAEIDRFAGQVASTAQPVGLYVALANGPDAVPLDKAEAAASKKHFALVAVYTDGERLARDAAVWSGLPATELATRFDSALSQWLVRMGCRDSTPAEWVARRGA